MYQYLSKVLYFLHAVLLFVFGILFVPQKEMWGPESDKTISNVIYAPIWKLYRNGDINGYLPVYELDTLRLLITLSVITLILYSVNKLIIQKT